MPYRFLEEESTADIAFEAWGGDLNELFDSAANALTAVMIGNGGSIERREKIPVALVDEDLDMLLYRFIEELIFLKDTQQLVCARAMTEVTERAGGWELRSVIEGETMDSRRHEQLVDVKAITMHDLWVRKCSDLWKAHVVLDI